MGKSGTALKKKKKEWFQHLLLLSPPFLFGFRGPSTFGGDSFYVGLQKDVCASS